MKDKKKLCPYCDNVEIDEDVEMCSSCEDEQQNLTMCNNCSQEYYTDEHDKCPSCGHKEE